MRATSSQLEALYCLCLLVYICNVKMMTNVTAHPTPSHPFSTFYRLTDFLKSYCPTTIFKDFISFIFQSQLTFNTILSQPQRYNTVVNHVLCRAAPQYFQYPPGRTCSLDIMIDHLPYPIICIYMTVVSLPSCTS